MAVVEQLLRSLHLDSPEPTPGATPSRRLSSPSPLSVSSTSSPSALTTPDNLSPLMSPHAIDFFPFSPTAQTPAYDRFPPFGPQISPSQNLLPHSKSGDPELFASVPRSKSLSSVASIRPFNPFSNPVSSPNGQTLGARPHQNIDPSKLPYRHASMPTVSQASADWIRPSDAQPLTPMHQSLAHQSLLQAQSLLDASFPQTNGQHQGIRRAPSPPQFAQGLNEVCHAVSALCQDPNGLPTQPINFLRLLQPTSQPPYDLFVQRIVKSSDQQASIFLQQKLKIADGLERMKIVDAIAARGFEMMVRAVANFPCSSSQYSVDQPLRKLGRSALPGKSV